MLLRESNAWVGIGRRGNHWQREFLIAVRWHQSQKIGFLVQFVSLLLFSFLSVFVCLLDCTVVVVVVVFAFLSTLQWINSDLTNHRFFVCFCLLAKPQQDVFLLPFIIPWIEQGGSTPTSWYVTSLSALWLLMLDSSLCRCLLFVYFFFLASLRHDTFYPLFPLNILFFLSSFATFRESISIFFFFLSPIRLFLYFSSFLTFSLSYFLFLFLSFYYLSLVLILSFYLHFSIVPSLYLFHSLSPLQSLLFVLNARTSYGTLSGKLMLLLKRSEHGERKN